MSRPVLRLVAPLAVGALTLGACGSTNENTDPAANPRSITVNATDTTCDVSATTAPAGTITFGVVNAGSKVTEFYVYGAGDRIVAEVENITPGLKRELKVELAEPATLTTACKPGMVGDGIRGQFTITGTAQKGTADEKVAKAVADYKVFVEKQTDVLLAQTELFVNAVKAGKVDEAKRLFPIARTPWETIEPVAEQFGDLDPKIDGREDVIAEGLKFTGFHRLEKDLWVSGLQADSSAIADQLLADVKTIVAKSKTVEPTALSMANGAKELLDEVTTGKITGEEDRYSHTDLWDFKGNLQGSQAALEALRPVITERDAELQKSLDARFADLNKLLDSYRVNGAFVSYTTLKPEDIKKLTVALDALGEHVAKVPAALEAK
jgi:iron uptake system component EfeO